MLNRRVILAGMTLPQAIEYDLLAQITPSWQIPVTSADGVTALAYEQRTVTFTDPEWREFLPRVSRIAAAAATDWAEATTPTRCPSCDHQPDMHQPDGCWYRIGTPGGKLNCPCTVPNTLSRREGPRQHTPAEPFHTPNT